MEKQADLGKDLVSLGLWRRGVETKQELAAASSLVLEPLLSLQGTVKSTYPQSHECLPKVRNILLCIYDYRL